MPLIIPGECIKPMSILSDDKVREQFGLEQSPYIFANSGKKNYEIVYLIQPLQWDMFSVPFPPPPNWEDERYIPDFIKWYLTDTRF